MRYDDPKKHPMKSFTNQNRRFTSLALTAAAMCLGLGIIQANGQSVEFTFADNTSDGWANSGFGSTPVASVSNIGGQNYIYAPYIGFQSANVASGNSGVLSGFNSAMFAALNNPAGYDISYNYYINTAAFSNDVTFLQLGIYVNTGSSYYQQDYSTPNQISFNGTQTASGNIFQGTVTENLATMGVNDTSAASETFFRLGLIENSNNTTSDVGVYYTDISITAVPEPATLSLCGIGAVAGWTFLRRRKG